MNSVKAEPLPPELHVIYPFGRPLIFERSKEGHWSVFKPAPPVKEESIKSSIPPNHPIYPAG